MFGFNGKSRYTVPTTQHNSPCLTSNTLSTRRTFSPPICIRERFQSQSARCAFTGHQHTESQSSLGACTYLEVLPCLGRIVFDDGLELGETKKVNVTVLLLIMFLSGETEGVERSIEGSSTSICRVRFVSTDEHHTGLSSFSHTRTSPPPPLTPCRFFVSDRDKQGTKTTERGYERVIMVSQQAIVRIHCCWSGTTDEAILTGMLVLC